MLFFVSLEPMDEEPSSLRDVFCENQSFVLNLLVEEQKEQEDAP